MARVLGSRMLGISNPGAKNLAFSVLKHLLRTRQRHAFSLMETGVAKVGDMDISMRYLRPDVGVVLNVGTDHYTAFRGKEGVALEKGKLVEALRENGTAILNADDPFVMGMRERTQAKIFTFGLALQADLRAENVRAEFPEPLSFTAVYGAERVEVRTALHGAHHVHNVLAALATGLVCGVPLADGVRAVEGCASEVARLQHVSDGRGHDFLDDAWKASMTSLEPAFAVLRAARAGRKWAVIGALSDYKGSGGDRYRKVATEALTFCDGVIFLGKGPSSGAKAKVPDGKILRGFESLREVDEFLAANLRAGDLLLLKGSGTIDHLERLYLHRQQVVSCWRDRCGRSNHCSVCPLLRTG